jgi:hypothetical protein
MARVAPSPRETADVPEEGATGAAAENGPTLNRPSPGDETLADEAARRLRHVQSVVTEMGGAWAEELRRLNSRSLNSLIPPAGFFNKIRAGRAAFYPELPWVRHSLAVPQAVRTLVRMLFVWLNPESQTLNLEP